MAGYTARRSSSSSAPLSAKRPASFSIRFLQAARTRLTSSAASGQSTIFFRPAVGKGMGRAARAASQPSAAPAAKADTPARVAESVAA